MAECAIELLSDAHDRSGFACGEGSLDAFLRQLAGQYRKKRIGQTYVAVRPEDPRVIGYYTLAASAVEFERVPAKFKKKLPKLPVPAVLLGRLAVDVSAKGRGLGADLLIDACVRSLKLSEQLGVHAVHVHALHDAAAAFYRKYGFEPLEDQPHHLFLPIATIQQEFVGDK